MWLDENDSMGSNLVQSDDESSCLEVSFITLASKYAGVEKYVVCFQKYMVSRIHSLLKALDPVLSEQGSVRSLDDMVRVVALMKDMHKLETRCTYLNLIMQTSEPDVLHKFVVAGGWKILNEWLAEVKEFSVDDTLFLEEVLNALIHLPVTIDVLKQNSTPKLIKNLSKDPKMNDNIHDLASQVVDLWMHVIKGNVANDVISQNSPNSANSNDSQNNAKSTVDKHKNGGEVKKSKKTKYHAPPSTGLRMTGLESGEKVKPHKRHSTDEHDLAADASALKKSKNENTNGHSSLTEKQHRKEEKRKLAEKEEKHRIKFCDIPDKTSTVVAKDKNSSKERHNSGQLGDDKTSSTNEKSTSQPSDEKSTEKLTSSEKSLDSVSSMPVKHLPKIPKKVRTISLDEKKHKTNLTQVTDFADTLFKPAAPIVKKKLKPKTHSSSKTDGSKLSSGLSSNEIKKEKLDTKKELKALDTISNENTNNVTSSTEAKNVVNEVEKKTGSEEVSDKISTEAAADVSPKGVDDQKTEETASDSEAAGLKPVTNLKPGEVKPILVYFKTTKKSRRITWQCEEKICRVKYFEVDENERTNFRKVGFQDFAKMELLREKMTLQRVKEGKEESLCVWVLHPLSELPAGHYSRGARSTEREAQDKREIGVLAEIYFDINTIPDTPREPDPENYGKKDPIMIPWEETSMDIDDSPTDKLTSLPMPPSIISGTIGRVTSPTGLIPSNTSPATSTLSSVSSTNNDNSGLVGNIPGLGNFSTSSAKTKTDEPVVSKTTSFFAADTKSTNNDGATNTTTVTSKSTEDSLINKHVLTAPDISSSKSIVTSTEPEVKTSHPTTIEDKLVAATSTTITTPAAVQMQVPAPNMPFNGPPPDFRAAFSGNRFPPRAPPPIVGGRPMFFDPSLGPPPPMGPPPPGPPPRGYMPPPGAPDMGMLGGMPLLPNMPIGEQAPPINSMTSPPPGQINYLPPRGMVPRGPTRAPPPVVPGFNMPPVGGGLPPPQAPYHMQSGPPTSQPPPSTNQGPGFNGGPGLGMGSGPGGLDASQVCRFYAMGHCKAGINCKFVHVPRGPPSLGDQDIDERTHQRDSQPPHKAPRRDGDNKNRKR